MKFSKEPFEDICKQIKNILIHKKILPNMKALSVTYQGLQTIPANQQILGNKVNQIVSIFLNEQSGPIG